MMTCMLSVMLLSCESNYTEIYSVAAVSNESELALADKVQLFKQLPSAGKEADRMQHRRQHNEMQATGYYVAPNSSITVDVGMSAGTTSARLVVGTPYKDNIRPDRQFFTLQEGKQTFTVDQYGGLVYIIYSANDYNSSGEITVTFEAGFVAVPYFQKGKTTHEQWVKTLNLRKDSTEDVMFVSDHTILIAKMDQAYQFKDEDQQLIVDRLDAIISYSNYISGLSGNQGVHAIPFNKHLITVRDAASGGYMLAAISIAYTESLSYRMLQPHYLSNINGWGIWHEVGHTYQQKAWTWENMGETTVNVYALAVERKFGLAQSRITTNNSWGKLASYFQKPLADRNYNEGDNDLKLIMFHQLGLAFGDELYIKLSQMSRDQRPSLSTDAEKMAYFMLSTCKIVQKDLSDFYRKWGFIVDESVFTAIANLQLPAPEQDITLLRD